jgi:hypothetical protein
MEVTARCRDTHKYFKTGRKIRHAGFTNDLERREREHRQKWPSGHICRVGTVTTDEAAREWEERQMRVNRDRRGNVHRGS